jgi:Beta-galactosidase
MSLDRNGETRVVYRTNQLATGKGTLAIRWTDANGRLIDDRRIAVTLNDENEFSFTIDLRRSTAMKNQIQTHFSYEGKNRKGEPDRRDEDARAEFIARPPDAQWRDYAIIMWQHREPGQVAALKKIGINGGEWVARTKSLPEFLLNNDVRWYAENMATDFYSEYHRYFPDRPVNWKFVETRERYKKDRSSLEPLKRHPSLSDPIWLARIHDRLVDSARFYAPYRPLFYSLGDESGIADLAAFWDFDFSDDSLQAMRVWLRQRYGNLQALNDQWATTYTGWDAVTPETTDQAMKRQDENYSAWSDFKEWMDIAYSRALKMGNDAIREVDPQAYVGIGGGQMPGWGGYDYSRIVKSLTAVEPYDIGNNIEIIRSLNPAMAVVTTAFARGPWEQNRVWYEMLHGNRGLIIWDDKSAFVNTDNTLGERGHEVAPYYKELTAGIAAQLINSERLSDPIAIHYSQPSMRVEWMLAQRPKGENWVTRNSSTEYKDSDFLRLRESYCKVIEDQGLQYNFVAYGQVEEGELVKRGYKVLILPHSTALSKAEAVAIRDFVERGGALIADTMPGVFDEHARRLPASPLADLFDTSKEAPFTSRVFGRGRAIYLNVDLLNYHRQRLVGKEGPVREIVGQILGASNVKPQVAVTDSAGKPVVGVETHLFRNGGLTIVAVMSNPQLRVDELGPPEFRSNDRFAKPAPVRVSLPGDRFVYDMRAAKDLGKRKEISVTVQPYEPTILAISPLALPELRLSAPDRASRGQNLELGVRFASPSVAASHIIHIDVVNPAGQTVDSYSGNLIAPSGVASKTIPLALNDATGRWQIRAHDLLTGQNKSVSFEVD